jgi:molecular chaperone HscB
MEQMELRETLEAIPEAENPPAALDHFLAEINNYEKEFVEVLRGQFATSTEESLKQANVAVKKLQFINKLKEETIELEDQLY